jgi:ubiquinone/menaquinone biosynthesis C-methylase UbiE
MARVDYDKQSEVYDRGRSLPPEAIDIWMATARRHAHAAGRILDLGAGTGRFSAALAETFDADVYAVEPSAGMRERANAKPHDRVHVVAGAAEQIPLPDASIDLAWLSNVVHHFDDLAKAAAEIRRVVHNEGTVLVRGAFGGVNVPTLYRFFPGSRAVVDSMPTMTEVIDAFQSAGFASFLNEKVEQLLAHSLADMVPRVRMRADTALELISDEEFEAGLRDLEEAARTETGPVYDVLDLLVVR